jgi:hypothetical protein
MDDADGKNAPRSALDQILGDNGWNVGRRKRMKVELSRNREDDRLVAARTPRIFIVVGVIAA